MISTAHQNTATHSARHPKKNRGNTHSLPVQKLDASNASHTKTPRFSSGRPRRPSGFRPEHFSYRCCYLSRYAAVILRRSVYTCTARLHPPTVYKCIRAKTCSLEYAAPQARMPCSVPSAALQTWTCCMPPVPLCPYPLFFSSLPYRLPSSNRGSDKLNITTAQAVVLSVIQPTHFLDEQLATPIGTLTSHRVIRAFNHRSRSAPYRVGNSSPFHSSTIRVILSDSSSLRSMTESSSVAKDEQSDFQVVSNVPASFPGDSVDRLGPGKQLQL